MMTGQRPLTAGMDLDWRKIYRGERELVIERGA